MTTKGWLKCTECGRCESDDDYTPSNACPGHDCDGVLHYFEPDDAKSRMLTCTECGMEAPISDQAPGASCPINECGGVMHVGENGDEEDPFDAADIVVSDEDNDADWTPVDEISPLEPANLTDETDIIMDDFDRDATGDIRGEALAEGIDKSRAEKLGDLVKDGYIPRKQSIAFPPANVATDSMTAGPSNPPNFDEYEMDVDSESAEALLVSLYAEIESAYQDGTEPPMQVVLGRPQYAILEPWSRAMHGKTFASILPEVGEVIVVPGPMLHAVRSPTTELFEYLEDDE